MFDYSIHKLKKTNTDWVQEKSVDAVANRAEYSELVSGLKSQGDYRFRVDVHVGEAGSRIDAVQGRVTDWIDKPLKCLGNALLVLLLLLLLLLLF